MYGYTNSRTDTIIQWFRSSNGQGISHVRSQEKTYRQ